jgi:hypothetical protein
MHNSLGRVVSPSYQSTVESLTKTTNTKFYILQFRKNANFSYQQSKMRLREAILLSTNKFDFLGHSDFSVKVLFPVVSDEDFIDHEILTKEEHAQVVNDCIAYSQRYKMFPDCLR